MSLLPFAPFRPDVIEDECGDLPELREFTKRKSNPDRTALNSLELEFVDP
jgi:hypothetical protein